MRKRFLLPLFFLVIHLIDLHAQSMPAKLKISACPGNAVDLEIASGDFGTPIPDNLEYSIGAATVANKNDSDADGWIDNGDPLIFTFGGQHFDPDLMKLTLYKPTGCLSNQKVYLDLISGNVKFYTTPDKYGKLDKFKFNCNELPKEIYVEAVDSSTTIRDIEIEMKYNNVNDKVRATSIWVNNTRTWVTWCPTDSSCDHDVENTKPKQGLLANLDDGSVVDIIADRISKDGSRYGHGYQNSNGTIDEYFGGRILFEFSVVPKLLPSEYADLGITFDCTRRRNSRVLTSSHGTRPTIVESVPFPLEEDAANDDTSINGEDNVPLNGLIYSWDAPAMPLYINNDFSFKAVKSTFEEFVRVGIWNAIPTNGTGLLGTRASQKIPWHNIYYTKSGINHILEPDNTSASVSSIKVRSSGNQGNGTCVVQLQGNPITEGYSFKYEGNPVTWRRNGVALTQGPTGTWTFSNNNIIVTIAKGAVSFFESDKFEFTVFVSNKKLNETGLSGFNDINSDF